jgi:putative heme-binding domain-containing protein
VWHGQVNPYGIAFDEMGNLFTADCHSKPAYCLLRGAYYPSFGKPHDGLGFGPKLIEHSHGSTSISGIAYYAANRFPEAYQDCVYMGNSVTGRVNRDKISATGSSLVGTECPDFVTCDDRWFRPVEIKMGPDGALYIADFYDCIIGYYEVPLTHPRRDRTRGRVWRVVYTGEEDDGRRRGAPNLTKADLEGLWQRLADPNLCVRLLATHEIVDRFGEQAVSSLKEWFQGHSTAHQRAHGLWVLERLHSLDDGLVERLAADEDRLVRLHLVKALAERADWSSSNRHNEWVVAKLSDADAMVRRAAADALGRHPSPDNVPWLLQLWAATPAEDTYLIHTVRMALRDQLVEPQILDRYAKLDVDEDQLQRLLDVSLGVRTPPSAAFVFSALAADKYDPSRITEWIHHATRYSAADQLDAVARLVLSWQEAEAADQLLVFRAYGLAIAERGAQIPPPFYAWGEQLAKDLLGHSNKIRVTEGIQVAEALRLKSLYGPLAEIVRSKKREADLRQAAMRACVATGDSRRLALLDGVLSDTSEAPGMRRAAAFSLSLLNTPESRERLLERMLTAHHELATLLAAALAGTNSGGEMLLKTITDGKASPLLLRELAVLRRLEGLKLPNLDERLDQLTAHLPPQDEMTAQRISQRRTAFGNSKPDAELGKEVFTKQCALCHQLSGEGREFGPDLDGIGVRGVERLLEDLLDPNRNVDPAFFSTVVLTMDGLIHTGLALRDEGNVLTLVDGEGKELKIRHDEIDDRSTSPLSPMPYVAENTVSAEDFNHLLRFLLDNNQPVESDESVHPTPRRLE